MKDWGYEELISAVKETYEECLAKDRGERYAVARTFDEFCDMGDVEDAIVYAILGEIIISQKNIYKGTYEKINQILKNISKESLEYELDEEETKDLLVRIEFVLNNINNIEVTGDPNAERFK